MDNKEIDNDAIMRAMVKMGITPPPEKKEIKRKPRKLDRSIPNIGDMTSKMKDGEEEPRYNHNIYLPARPYRMVICGPSGCGKSNLMTNLLLNDLVDYDALYIITKTPEQTLYTGIRKRFEALAKKNKNFGDRFLLSSSLDDLPAIENLEGDQPLIIIDDFLADAKLAGRGIVDFMFRLRHKNGSIMILGQSFYTFPKPIRENASHFCLFKGCAQGVRNLRTLHQGVCETLEFEPFAKLFAQATAPDKPGQRSYNFMYIDKETEDEKLKIRKNFQPLEGVTGVIDITPKEGAGCTMGLSPKHKKFDKLGMRAL